MTELSDDGIGQGGQDANVRTASNTEVVQSEPWRSHCGAEDEDAEAKTVEECKGKSRNLYGETGVANLHASPVVLPEYSEEGVESEINADKEHQGAEGAESKRQRTTLDSPDEGFEEELWEEAWREPTEDMEEEQIEPSSQVRGEWAEAIASCVIE